MHKHIKKATLTIIILTLLMALQIISGCGQNAEAAQIDSLDDIKDMELRIAYPDDLNLDDRIKELCPNAHTVRFSEADILNTFASNKIDSAIVGENFCKNIIRKSNGTLRMLDTPVESYKVAFATSKTSNIPNLKEKVNEFIAQGIESGQLQEIYDRWQDPDYDETMPDVPIAANPEYTLIIGTADSNKPFCYYKNNKLTGADIEIAYYLAEYLNAKPVFEASNYSGIIAGLNTGKYDILAAGLYYTEERAQSLDFSDPYYIMNINMLVKNTANNNSKLESLNGKKAGVVTGTPHVDMINKVVDDASFEYFNSFSDLGLALNQNKIDFFVNNNVAFELMKDEYPDFVAIEEPVCTFDIGTIFPKNRDNQELINQYNEYISKIEQNGTLKELQDYWLNGKDWEKLPPVSEGRNGTLTLATCTSNKPFGMMLDGDFAGFDIAIVYGFCEEYGYGLKIEDCDFAGMLAGIANGKYDFAAAQIAYTPERAENVIYSKFYYTQKIVAIVKDDFVAASGSNKIWDSLKSGFKKTFIDENRYLMIISGIEVTLIITVFGFILAGILGAFLCAMSMSGVAILRAFANAYSKVMQGTPIVVILMIIYYVIFGKSSISNVFVAILGFGFSTAAYIAQIYEGAIEQVTKGEIEAALALGLSRRGTFIGIILPQAFRHSIVPLSSQLVGLMKGTAVVGYIAVMDMTKVSDIIRSSTYEAFFPLLSIAVIYFIISTIILMIFDKIRIHMNPANKKRQIKGV